MSFYENMEQMGYKLQSKDNNVLVFTRGFHSTICTLKFNMNEKRISAVFEVAPIVDESTVNKLKEEYNMVKADIKYFAKKSGYDILNVFSEEER